MGGAHGALTHRDEGVVDDVVASDAQPQVEGDWGAVGEVVEDGGAPLVQHPHPVVVVHAERLDGRRQQEGVVHEREAAAVARPRRAGGVGARPVVRVVLLHVDREAEWLVDEVVPRDGRRATIDGAHAERHLQRVGARRPLHL